MATSSLQQMAASITERSKTLINNDLKKILKEEGTSQTGNKAALQARVIGLIQGALYAGDMDKMHRLQHRVQNNGSAPSVASSSPAASSYVNPAASVANGYTMSNGYQSNGQYQPPYQVQQPQMPPRPAYFFKDSPFFEIRELLLSGIVLETSPSHRQNVNKTLAPSDAVAARMKSDPSLRLLLFSSVEAPLNQYTKLDITFPSQIEVKINGHEVKANYKGLKNKPGSTRPVDITDFVRTSPANYRNSIQITYALTQKKYTLSVYMVKKFTIEDLTKKIKQRHVITKQSVLSEMMKNANDPDIEVGSSVMSLKDPISTLRISTPCRSTICTHNQCFDAESFLQLQEQAPTWTCPICNKTISYEGLAVDQYVEEILSKARDTDQVTIEPNGSWSISKDESPKKNGHGNYDDESDDDLVELPSDYRLRHIKTEAVPAPMSYSTPPLGSRETSSAPRSGQKRTAEVVDLTLSDDDEPPRPTKKVAYSTPNSMPDQPRPYLPPPQSSSHAAAHNRPLPPSNNYPSSMRSFLHPPLSEIPSSRSPYGSYSRQPLPPPAHGHPPRYSGSGSSTHPTYLGSSP